MRPALRSLSLAGHHISSFKGREKTMEGLARSKLGLEQAAKGDLLRLLPLHNVGSSGQVWG